MEIDYEKLSDAVADALHKRQAARGFDHDAHAAHHECLARMIAAQSVMEEKEARIIARNERIREKVAGTFVVGAAVGAVGLIGAGALGWLRDNLFIR